MSGEHKSNCPHMSFSVPQLKPVKQNSFDWLADPPCPVLSPFQQSVLSVDWATSPLGLISKWTPWLKQMVLLVIADPDPALLYVDDLGGNPHAVIYNEALCPLIGEKVKHPCNKLHFINLFWSSIPLFKAKTPELGESYACKI